MASGYLPSVHFSRNIYWSGHPMGSGQPLKIPDYIQSDNFGGVGRIYPAVNYPASPPYGTVRYRSDLKKYLGFKQDTGWGELGGAAGVYPPAAGDTVALGPSGDLVLPNDLMVGTPGASRYITIKGGTGAGVPVGVKFASYYRDMRIVLNDIAPEEGIQILDGTTIRFRLAQGGGLKLTAYGAGTATFDAAGNISSVSDKRFKSIKGNFIKGLVELKTLRPILYKWNKKSKLETEYLYVGFVAQDVKKTIPEAVGLDSQGFFTLSDRAIIAVLVNAVKSLSDEVDKLKRKYSSLDKL
jgi:hypothetical protein